MSSVKIINDDAIEVLKQLNDECIDLIVTDPPYKVTARGCAGNSGGMMQKKLSMHMPTICMNAQNLIILFITIL